MTDKNHSISHIFLEFFLSCILERQCFLIILVLYNLVFILHMTLLLFVFYFVAVCVLLFIRPFRDRPYYVIGYGGCGRPHRFSHDNLSSVYRIFTKLDHMIPLWKGKNPIYFWVIRSKVKVTVTINIIFDNRIVSAR